MTRLFFLLCVGLAACAPGPGPDMAPADDMATPPRPVGDAMPPGAIAYFRSPECPTGWSAYTLATGRVVVPLRGNGDSGMAQGAPLSPGEDRGHGHTISGSLTTRSVSYIGIAGEANHGVANAGTYSLSGSAAGGGDGLPYAQLRLCRKDSAAVAGKRPLPTGTLSFFEQSCPDGWTRAGATQGRILVGLPAGGAPGAAFGGTALAAGEARKHKHSLSGKVILGSHGIALGSGCCAGGYAGQGEVTYSGAADDAAAGPPTLQLVQCQKL